MNTENTLVHDGTETLDNSDPPQSFDDWFEQLTPSTRAALVKERDCLLATSARQEVRKADEDMTDPTDAHRSLVTTLERLAVVLDRISTPATTQTVTPEALSKEDAAKFLGVSIPTIEHLIRARKVQYVQLGAQRGRVIPVDALRKLLHDNTQLTAKEELRRRGRR